MSADGVVQFKGSYIAIGEEDYGCCANGRSYLNKGLIWTSTDGRHWQLHQVASLDGAAIRGLLTDGSHLYAYGAYAAVQDVTGGFGVGAVWVSTDGLTWARSTPSGMVQGIVALAPNGLLGVRATFDNGNFSSFLRSTDGLHWTATSGRYPVVVAGVAVGSDGSVLAIAWPEDSSFGTDVETVAFRSADGSSWRSPEPISDVMLTNLVAVPGGFMTTVNGELSGDQVFRITASASASAVDLGSGPLGGHMTNLDLIAAGEIVIARGYVEAEATSVTWVSTNSGLTFGLLPGPVSAANADASLTGVVETPSGLLAVGKTGFVMAPGGLPVAWLIER